MSIRPDRPRPRGARPFRSAHGAPRPVVKSAVAEDLPFIVMLQKAHAAALGFLPRQALGEKIGLGQVLLARVAGRRAGFLHHGSLGRPEVRVFQIAVRPEARAKGIGGALVDALLETASASGARGLSLRCLSFLEANGFWRAVGFRIHSTEPGAKGILNVWVRRLDAGTPEAAGDGFTFATRVHPCPLCRTPTVDTWVRGGRRRTLCPACVEAASMN
jgi:GNAT superfamily N-acetyltransferase